MPHETQRSPRTESGSPAADDGQDTTSVEAAKRPFVWPPFDQRRAELVARDADWPLQCPTCGWVVIPIEALHLDRWVRLVEHLAAVHEVDLHYMVIALRHVAQEIAEAAA